MITWKDFILDDQIGPQLIVDSGDGMETANCRRTWDGRTPSVMDDAMGLAANVPIQETGQDQRSARMVGHSGLESIQRAAGFLTSRDAGEVSVSASCVQQEGTG